MGEGSIKPTILTTEKAKIIDLILAVGAAQHVLLIASSGNGERVQKWLQRYVIMENITVEDVTPDYRRLSLLGPKAVSLANRICGQDVSGQNETACLAGENGEFFMYRDPLWPVPFFHIVWPAKTLGSVEDSTTVPHPDLMSVPKVRDGVVEVARIEWGVPKFGSEITDRVNPLEAGLSRFVSFTKGCYIGQEVIARVDTYSKLQRRLRGFIFPAGCRHTAPGRLYWDGAEAGWTTSHGYSRQLGKEVALGYLKGLPEARMIEFRHGDGETATPLEVVDIPFPVTTSTHSSTVR